LKKKEKEFSLFRFSDSETQALVEELTQLAKGRIYTYSIQLGQQKKKYLDEEYGRLHEIHSRKWIYFWDKATHNVNNIKAIDEQYELKLNFESSPKWESLVAILRDLQAKFREQANFAGYAKRLKKEETSRQAQELRKLLNGNVLVVLKNLKTSIDLKKYLTGVFVKGDGGRSYFEQKFKYMLTSHAEFAKREKGKEWI